MTSAARTAVSPSPRASRTRARTREAPAERAQAHPRGQAHTLATTLLGGLAGLAAAAVFVAIAPAAGRGASDDLGRAVPRSGAVVRDRELATPLVASVLTSAVAAGVLPVPDPAEATP